MTAKYFFARASGLALGYVRNSLWWAQRHRTSCQCIYGH